MIKLSHVYNDDGYSVYIFYGLNIVLFYLENMLGEAYVQHMEKIIIST